MRISKNVLIYAVLLSCFVLSSSVKAQDETMTNQEVISLVKAGLSNSLIINKIHSSKNNFSLSADSMIDLKKAGVSDDVISAMLDAKNGQGGFSDSQPAAPQPQPQPQGASTATSEDDKALKQVDEPGIYILENGKMLLIEPTVFSGTKTNPLGGIMTYGIKKTKMRAKVRGKAANMQISAAQPVFYFVFNPEYKNSGATMAGGMWWGLPATSPAEFMMVEMAVKDASREAVVGEYGTFSGMSTGARDKDVREYSFQKLRPGVYRVVPKSNLAPGEYCFYYAATISGLGIGGGKIFDFGIKK